MKTYHIFGKIAIEGDYLHLTASLEANPPFRYSLLGTQLGFSKSDAILRFFSSHTLDLYHLKNLLINRHQSVQITVEINNN